MKSETITVFRGLIAISLLALLNSCGIENPDNRFVQTHQLKKVGAYHIEIDSVTAGDFIHYQYYKEGDNEYFTLLNPILQEINFYDLETKSLSFKIPLKYNGPDRVGTLDGFNAGYHIHSLDSIYALNRKYVKLFLIDSQSRKRAEYNLKEGRLPSPVIAPFAPMLVHQGNAIMLNFQSSIDYFSRNKKFRSDYATILNLTDSSQQQFLSYPEIYSDGAWGLDLYRVSWVFDKQKERIVINYALDNQLYVYDFDGNFINSFKASSPLMKKPRSISKKQSTSKTGMEQYYFSQSKYEKLFFDENNRIYLRECVSAISIDDQNSGRPGAFKRSIVLLDEDLNKMGELDASHLGRLRWFFHKNQIHLFVPDKEEDRMKFEVYNIEPLIASSSTKEFSANN